MQGNNPAQIKDDKYKMPKTNYIQITEEKEKEIRQKVKNILKDKPEIDTFFHPLIEEFFVRVQDQYNLDEKQLEVYLNRFSKVTKISFTDELEDNKTSGVVVNNQFYDDYTSRIKVKPYIEINSIYLESILEGDKKYIEDFIDVFFHEMGHLIQVSLYQSSILAGVKKTSFKKNIETLNPIAQEFRIMNEYAEIVNARKLTTGVADGNYQGYENEQLLAKATYIAMGITDEVAAELQMLGIPIDVYISNNSSHHLNDMLMSRLSVDEIQILNEHLMYTFKNSGITVGAIEYVNKSNNAKKEEMFNSYIVFLNANLMDRILCMQEPTITKLAQVMLDKQKMDEYVKKSLELYKKNHLLPEEFEVNQEDFVSFAIGKYNLSNEQLEFLNNEFQRLKEQEEAQALEKREMPKYDNSSLISALLESSVYYNFSNINKFNSQLALKTYRARRILKSNVDLSKFSVIERMGIGIDIIWERYVAFCEGIENFIKKIMPKTNKKALPESTIQTQTENSKFRNSLVQENYKNNGKENTYKTTEVINKLNDEKE